MAENEVNDLVTKLQREDRVVCPKCNKGIVLPYNTTADKAHYFNCTNCDFFVHLDPIINIE